MKGVRYGGKPKGWRKPEGVRTQHQIRAYADEWLVIRDFIKILREKGAAKTAALVKNLEDVD